MLALAGRATSRRTGLAVRSYAKMNQYRFLKEEVVEGEGAMAPKKEKKQRRLSVTPAGA